MAIPISKSVPLDGILSALAWPWILLQVGLCGILFHALGRVTLQKETRKGDTSPNNHWDKTRNGQRGGRGVLW